MNYQTIIEQYYPDDDELRCLLLHHSRQVADRCLQIVHAHRELPVDVQFLEEAAMLHDIGIRWCHAPSIFCLGNEPYIRHGLIGGNVLRELGFERHARVCERHTGTGLTLDYILTNNLPLPHRDLVPVSLEEQLICFADKFFSKTHPEQEKSKEAALKSVAKFGEECAEKFNLWSKMFL
jgi:uncharacterized protein